MKFLKKGATTIADRVDFYSNEDYLAALAFEAEIDAENNAQLEAQAE